MFYRGRNKVAESISKSFHIRIHRVSKSCVHSIIAFFPFTFAKFELQLDWPRGCKPDANGIQSIFIYFLYQAPDDNDHFIPFPTHSQLLGRLGLLEMGTKNFLNYPDVRPTRHLTKPFTFT